MRNLGLDLLRLIAVILVLGRHLELPSNPNIILHLWKTGGWIGVDLFFVLSGFLVSGLLFKEQLQQGTLNIKRFLIRRGFKIYPAFYALIIFTIGVLVLRGEKISPSALFGELFFVQNYTGGLWNHTWSLAVEEHFYFGIAILFYILVKTRKSEANPFSRIPLIFVFLAITCALLRLANLYLWENYSHQKFLFGTHLRIDSLMFGVFLSYHWHHSALEDRVRRIPSAMLLMAGTVLMLPAFIFPVEHYKLVSIFGVILFYLGSGFLVLAATKLPHSSNPVLIFCGNLGAASYSIYLWHLPISVWGWWFLTKFSEIQSFAAYFLFYMIGSLVFGWIMNKLIEWPVLRMRERLFPKTSSRVSKKVSEGT
jgi:peptidoglycan/LPS O-acetylase OafA/YrhL